MTEDRRARIREAALEVFLRYGYRHATMDDIAREVGVSRPALYLVFPGKEAVFREVVEVGLDEILREIDAGVHHHKGLAAQLRDAFEIWSVRSFEMVSRSPHAAELMASPFDFVRDVFDHASRRLACLLARLIRAAVANPETLQPPAEVRARVMIAAVHGFKTSARDPEAMRAFVHDLVRMTVAGLPLATDEAAARASVPAPRRRRTRG